MYKSEVIAFYKTRVALAQALGISPSSISQWGKIIPEKQAHRLVHLSNGQLKFDNSLYQKNTFKNKIERSNR